MAKYARWTFKNKTKKDIIITSIGLWAKDNQTVMAEAKRKIHLKRKILLTYLLQAMHG